MGRGKFGILLSIAALVLAGCASTAKVQSVRSQTYEKIPQRLFIVADFSGGFAADPNNDIATRVEKSLRGCGLDISFARLDTLAIEQPLPQRISAFSPDAVLSIRWTSSSTYGGVQYLMELQDMASKAVVWKAEMNLRPGEFSGLTGEYVTVFTTELISRLKADKLVPQNCNALKTALSAEGPHQVGRDT